MMDMSVVPSKEEYDFLTWTSFPSSAKIVCPRNTGWSVWPRPVAQVSVIPGSTVKIEANAKQQNVLKERYRSAIPVDGFNGEEWSRIWPAVIHFPLGTFDWRKMERSFTVPSDVEVIRVLYSCGAGISEDKPGITWLDDLKIYQDDKLIYANDFSNLNPYIGAGALGVASGIGAHQLTKDIPTAIGAGVVGSLIGAAIGYFIPPLV